jgi:UDP-N-acetylmuramate dehydrogenase
MDQLYDNLKKFGQVKLNESMSKHTTFRIGGKARYFVIVEETEKLVELLRFLDGEGEKYFIIGGGSNLLVSDDEYEGVVIKVHSSQFRVQSDVIELDAGVFLSKAVSLATENGLSGLEWAVGVPGTVGGAVYGNAGAFRGSMQDVVWEVDVYQNGEVVTLNKEECDFGYRQSIFKKEKLVVLTARLKLAPKDKQLVMAETTKTLIERMSKKFPTEPSAGCFFKNVPLGEFKGDKKELPEKFLEINILPVAWLIEQSGMKGVSVGGAEMASTHSNYLINKEQATAKDVLRLVEKVKEKVYNKFGVEIEEEVQIL